MPLLNVFEYICDEDRIEDMCLPSLTEKDCRVAIQQVADLFSAVPLEEVYNYYPDGALWIRFLLPDRALFDNDFYNHVRLNCPGAVPELQKLVEASSAHFDCDFRSGSFFAAFALAWLDEASLPIVARFFHTIDAEHNGWFHEEEVLGLVARHGWSLPMIDFTIAWLELADGTYGGDRPLDNGLRAGARARMSGEDFARRYHDVLAQHGLGAYAEEKSGRDPGWHPSRYFGTGAIDRIWFSYYESFAEYIGFFGREQTTRTHASFQKIVDEASWQSLKQEFHLNEWDRTFFTALRQIADVKAPLPRSPSRT